MKTLIILLLLIITSEADQEENVDNNNHCRWKYKCCKLFKGTCIKMCEPEIDCNSSIKEDVEVIETAPNTFFGFASVSALNARCKFGFKIDAKHNCRRVLK